MGMFDYVLHEGRRYQTKDFEDPFLETYRIENGRLLFDEGRYEEVPENERPHPDAPGFENLIGSIRYVIERPGVDQDFHGDLHLVEEEPPSRRFVARFRAGNLVAFEAEPDREDNQEGMS